MAPVLSSSSKTDLAKKDRAAAVTKEMHGKKKIDSETNIFLKKFGSTDLFKIISFILNSKYKSRNKIF